MKIECRGQKYTLATSHAPGMRREGLDITPNIALRMAVLALVSLFLTLWVGVVISCGGELVFWYSYHDRLSIIFLLTFLRQRCTNDG